MSESRQWLEGCRAFSRVEQCNCPAPGGFVAKECTQIPMDRDRQVGRVPGCGGATAEVPAEVPGGVVVNGGAQRSQAP